MRRRSEIAAAAVCLALVAACAHAPAPAGDRWRAALLTAAASDTARLAALQAEGFDTVVLVLDDVAAGATTAARVRARGFRLGWWIEVGRCPALADERPELLASLQGHGDWLRAFPAAPAPARGQVVKTWPWVPLASAEGFAAQRERVTALLAAAPPADLVFLNDLQAAPSACGCGSSLCRWTADYGPVRTNTPLGDDAAALFCAAVQRVVPRSRVLPVWVTECEPHDPACGSVPCFDGACWKAFRRQWAALVAQCDQVAVLLSARALDRDPAWPAPALALLREQTREAPAATLVAVLDPQSPAPAGLATVTAFAPLEQSFEPRLLPVRDR